MEFAQAAPLSCAGVTIYAAIKRAGLKPGDTLGIVGLGSLGILGVQMARKMGFKTVGVDSRPEPVELAKSLGQVGSDYLVLQSDTSPTEAVKQIKQMSPNAEWDGLDAVILATDTQESFKYATEVLKRHGTFVLVGQYVLSFCSIQAGAHH